MAAMHAMAFRGNYYSDMLYSNIFIDHCPPNVLLWILDHFQPSAKVVKAAGGKTPEIVVVRGKPMR